LTDAGLALSDDHVFGNVNTNSSCEVCKVKLKLSSLASLPESTRRKKMPQPPARMIRGERRIAGYRIKIYRIKL
jgi:hypothetical protein